MSLYNIFQVIIFLIFDFLFCKNEFSHGICVICNNQKRNKFLNVNRFMLSIDIDIITNKCMKQCNKNYLANIISYYHKG